MQEHVSLFVLGLQAFSVMKVCKIAILVTLLQVETISQNISKNFFFGVEVFIVAKEYWN